MKLKNKTIAIILGSTLIAHNLNYLKPLSITTFYTEKDLNFNDFNTSNFSDEIKEKLQNCFYFLNLYKNDKDINILKECIAIFCSIPKLIQGGADFSLERNGVLDYIFYKIRSYIYSINDLNEQNNLIILFGEEIFKGWRKNKNIEDYSLIYLIEGLVKYNKDKNNNAQSRLDYLESLYFYFKENEDNDPYSDEIPNINTEVKPEISEPMIPPNIDILPDITPDYSDTTVGDSTLQPEINPPSEDILSQSEEYIKKNNKCVKVTSYYKNGVLAYSSQENVPTSEYIKCGIDSYLHNNNTVVTQHSNTVIDKNHIHNNQNENSDYYIYYTINKNSKNPYYFNSGIKASTNKTITYNQLKDAFYQIAIESNGFNISDNNKTLIILEGTSLVINNNKDVYSESEINNLTKTFKNIGIKISENIENKSEVLENLLLKEKLDTITINNEELKLSSPLKVSNNQLLAPIEEVANYLGIKTSLQNNKLILSKGSNTATLEIDSPLCHLNRVEKILSVNTSIINSNIYSELFLILDFFGYDIVWDNDEEKIYINNKEKGY